MFRRTAHVYDLIYRAVGKDYAAEAGALHEQIQARNGAATSLLDVACGTGAHLAHLRAWYEVAGVEIEREMLAQARERLPGALLVQADMRRFELRRTFDAVVCLFSSIGYMESPDELGAAIGCMARHLSPGGVLVVDGWIRPDTWIEPGVVQAEAAPGQGIAVARVSRSRREGRKTHLEMHHLVGTHEGIEHIVEHHELTLFEREEYVAGFGVAGLDVEIVESPMGGRDRYIGVKGG